MTNATSQTTLLLPDGSVVTLADWVDDRLWCNTEMNPPPPWDDPCSRAGWLADLVLAVPTITRTQGRAARCIRQLAKRHDISNLGIQSAARYTQAVTAESTEAVYARRRDTSPFVYRILKGALATLRAAADRNGREVWSRSDIDTFHNLGVDVVRLEVRWRIRDWVGRVPVPPHVRQAACAAWMTGHYKFTRKLVEDYVNDWLAE
jgi:hypothetical protein